uniref:Bm516 n=1 Tax=Brugia malayi TaxID=6279 RepID=A0A0H5S919_BRUMA|nr:Bm516 [Brugia malayi]
MNLSTYIIIFICIGLIFGKKETHKKGIKGLTSRKYLNKKKKPTPKQKCKDKWKDCSQVMLYGDCFRFPHYASGDAIR